MVNWEHPRDDDDSNPELKRQNMEGFAYLVTAMNYRTEEAKVAFLTVVNNKDPCEGYMYGNFKQAWKDLKYFYGPDDEWIPIVKDDKQADCCGKEEVCAFILSSVQAKFRGGAQSAR